MKKIIKKTIRIILSPFILKDYFVYKSKDKESIFTTKLSDFYPQIKDKTITTNFDHHYVYHTSWAVRKVKEINPNKHIDISSSLYFCGLLSAFIPVDFYDYRPANLTLSGLNSKGGDLHDLPFEDNSITSISCMHTIEHIGLGRYGDPIDPNGDVKAIKELKRVLAKDGYLIFVTPVGKPKIEFNAHRIYSHEQIMDHFNKLTLEEFSLVTDDGKLIEDADPDLVSKQKYGCGLYLFKK